MLNLQSHLTNSDLRIFLVEFIQKPGGIHQEGGDFGPKGQSDRSYYFGGMVQRA